MNWLKAMLLMVVLGAILYGVNLVLNKTAPVESPANSGAWTSTDGAMPSPAANRSTAGINVPPAPVPSPYGQTPPEQSAYSSTSGTSAATNPPMGVSANGPPPAAPTGYQAGVYQPASPPIVNSDPPHASIPATTVGLTTAAPSSAPPAETPGSSIGGHDFATTMDSVMATLRDGKLAEGLRRLTLLYDAPQLSPDQSKQLNDLLGRLAGTVVYSRQHLLLPPYEIKPGDRLETIANEHQVPAALLAKINGIRDPDHLTPGNQLKVIQGPFMALVSLNKREVTLVVQQCYAGRFQLTGVGKDAAELNGVYKVDRKLLNVAGDINQQRMPNVHHWIDFNNGFGLCGLLNPNMAAEARAGLTAAAFAAGFGDDDPRGLALSSPDAEDLFDILSVGSSVVVR